MRPIYHIIMRMAYVMADIAEYILDPIANNVWEASGALEYWANEKLTKGDD